MKLGRGKLIKNILLIGTAVFFIGIWQGWWSFDSVKAVLDNIFRK